MASTSSGTSRLQANKDRDKDDMGESSSGDKKEKEEPSSGQAFECNICLDTAKDAVISLCGHLFCWPCLHQWLEYKPNKQVCPVCKAAISKDKIIPVYGRSGSTEDPRNKVPPRPQGQRTEPENNTGFPGSWGFGEGFTMSFGIGAFPFGLFSSTFNLGDQRPPPGMPWGGLGMQFHHHHHQVGVPEVNEAVQQIISKFFLIIAVVCLLYILFGN